MRLLRRLREARGQSLRQAADEMGVAASHLSRVERGEKGASERVSEQAARYYGVSEDLLALDEGRVPADVVLILQRNPDLLEEIRRNHG